MNSRLAVALFSCLLALTLAACGKSSSGGGSTNIRVMNAIPDAPAISLTLDTTSVVTNLPFQGLTQYIGVDSGNREFKVSANGGASNAIDTTLGIAGNTNYTYIVYNPVASAAGLLLSDSTFATPNSGTFGFRVINVAAGVGLVDLYLAPPGTDINSTSPTVASVPVGGISAVTAPNAATLELRVTAAGTKQVIYDTPAQNFVNGSNYEAVI